MPKKRQIFMQNVENHIVGGFYNILYANCIFNIIVLTSRVTSDYHVIIRAKV